MTYDVLIINEEKENSTAQRGLVCDCRRAGRPFGKQELTSRFKILQIELDNDEQALALVNKQFIYDFNDGNFKKNEVIFNRHEYASKKNFIASESDISDRIANQLDSKWKTKSESSCKFLHPDHLPYPENDQFGEQRKYWSKKFATLIEYEGIKNLIAAFQFGDYGDIINTAVFLDKEVKNAIMQSSVFTKEDKQWFIKVWKYGNDSR